jgi:predicted NUDIX family phosphoesterase
MKTSHILCVTNHSVKLVVGDERGFIDFPKDIESFPFDANEVWIGPRKHLEEMETFRQLIPYVIVARDDKFLVYKRTKKGGESRLHDKFSLGFGGHIDVSDVTVAIGGQSIDLDGTIANAAAREMIEELNLSEGQEYIPYGMIVDDGDAVGRVHVGIVLIAHVTGIVVSREPQIDLVGFKTLEEIDAMELEGWSRILIDALVGTQ